MEAPVGLQEARPCLEGVLPAVIATADAGGTPNITYLSKVFYVDAERVALSNQFFSKTVANIRRNPFAQLTVMHPENTRHYRLDLEYERSMTSGDLFETARAEIDAIASLMGAQDLFRLRALDVYRVLRVYRVPCDLDSDDV